VWTKEPGDGESEIGKALFNIVFNGTFCTCNQLFPIVTPVLFTKYIENKSVFMR
jgi:hypothetical protein